MINLYKQVKQYLKPIEIVRFYLGDGNLKAGSYWYVSPFRKEKTASFCANDRKGIHDFGDNTHYDIISFTQKLFDIGPMQAVKRLIVDFNLPIELEDNRPRIHQMRDLALYKQKRAKEQAEKQAIQDFYDQMYECASSKFKKYGVLIQDLQINRKALKNANLAQIYANKDYLEWIVDILLENTPEEVWENRKFWEEVVLWS